jgi:hypothetical protein
MRGSRLLKGTTTLSTSTSGANLLPDRSSLHQSSRSEPDTAPECEPTPTHPVTFRGRWWTTLPEELSTRRARNNERVDRARRLREADHIAGHPHIPLNLVKALQRGVDPEDQPFRTTVTVDGQRVHVAISSRGTGIPEPDSQGAWDAVCATYREVSTSPYCADIVLPLPQEIAAIGWTTPAGQAVNVTPCKPQRLRAILSVALIPLARMGELGMSATTGSAAAALALGTSSLSPVPIPAEPTPDLQPKTGSVAQRLPQADRATRSAPGKVRIRVRHTALGTVGASAHPRTPHPIATSTTPLASAKSGSGPAPREQLSASPEPAPQATPAVAAEVSPTPTDRPHGGGTDWRTLLPSVPSLLPPIKR